MDDFAGRSIAAARRRPQDPGCPAILNQLMEARDPETGEQLSNQALVDETKTLFLAGYETTAIALCWALQAIAFRPDVAAQWRRELDEVLGGRQPSAGDLGKLVYTAQIINEVLRFYPPVYNMVRKSTCEDEIRGERVRKGTLAVISIYGMHRGPAWGHDAETFRPDRFAPGCAWPKKAFLPFGSGPHVCLGNHFAITEMMVALAMLGQRYEFQATTAEPARAAAHITLIPDREITLRITRRRFAAGPA